MHTNTSTEPLTQPDADHPEQTLNSSPKRLLMGSVIAIGVIIALMVWVNSARDTDEVASPTPPQTFEDFASPPEAKGAASKPSSNLLANALNNSPATTVNSPFATDSTEVEPSIRNRLDRIEKLLETLRETLLAQSTPALDQDPLSEQLQPLSASITALTDRFTALEKQLSQQSAPGPIKTRKKPRRTFKRQPLPFTLVSIDAWGDQHNAVLRVKGQIKTLRPGDHLSGWTLDAIDLDNEQVLFSYPKRRKPLILKIQG